MTSTKKEAAKKEKEGNSKEQKENEKEERKKRSEQREKEREFIEIHKMGTIPLVCFVDGTSNKKSSGLMHRLLTMINLMSFRGDQFRQRPRVNPKMNGHPHPLDHNVVTKQIALFIRENLMHRHDDNRYRQKLAIYFAQELVQFVISQLKVVLNSVHLDAVQWGQRSISYRDEQLIPRYFEGKTTSKKSKKEAVNGVTSNNSNSSKSKGSGSGSGSTSSSSSSPLSTSSSMGSTSSLDSNCLDHICLERIAMILEQLLAAECVEMYTPLMYNMFWDLIQRTTNIFVKAMAFKFVTHLEVHWNEYAVNKTKPRRMTKTIFMSLHTLWDDLYRMEGRSENDQCSPILNALSQFLSRPQWDLKNLKKSNDSMHSKEEKVDDQKEKETKDDKATNDNKDSATNTEQEEKKETQNENENEIETESESKNQSKKGQFEWRTLSMDIVIPEEMTNYKKKREWNTFILGEGMTSGSAFWSFQITSSRRPSMMCFGVMGTGMNSKDSCFDSVDNLCVGAQYGSIGLLGDGSLWRFGKMVSQKYSNTRFESGTKIGIYLDLDRGELVFTVNGKNARTGNVSTVAKKGKFGFKNDPIRGAAVNCYFAETMPTVNASSDFQATSPPTGRHKTGHDEELTKKGIMNGIGIQSRRDLKQWFPAVSMYSKKDGIRLIENECWRRDGAFDADSDRNLMNQTVTALPPSIPCSFEFVKLLQTVMATVGGNKNGNGNDSKRKIPRSVIQEVSKWLQLWIKNETRFWRFDGIGYEVRIRSKLLSTLKKEKGVVVGDLVNISPNNMRCRVWGELNGRVLVKRHKTSTDNRDLVFLIPSTDFDRISCIEPMLKRAGKVAVDSDDSTHFEEGEIRETLHSLTADDLIAINAEIKEMATLLKKMAFDLTMNDFMTMKMEMTLKSLCSFALLQWMNRRYHFLFPLCSSSTFWSFWNQSLFGPKAIDLMFESVRVSFTVHLWRDSVNEQGGNSVHSQSASQVQLDPFHSIPILNQLGIVLRGNMKTFRLTVMDDRGQIKPFTASYKLQSTGNQSSDRDGGQNRQCFHMIQSQCFGHSPSPIYMFRKIANDQVKDEEDPNDEANDEAKNEDLWVPDISYNGDLSDYELFGRILGLSIRSQIPMDIPFPDWFWQRIWKKKEDELLVDSHSMTSMAIDKFNAWCNAIKRWIVGKEIVESVDADAEEMTAENVQNVINEDPSTVQLTARKVAVLLMDFIDRDRAAKCRKISKYGADHNEEEELKQMAMDWMNIARYDDLNRFDCYIDAIRRGLFAVVPPQIALLMRSPMRLPTGSMMKMTVSRLRSTAIYLSPLSADNDHIQSFWSVLESFDESELRLFMLFMSGNEQWPSCTSNAMALITVNVKNDSIWKNAVKLKEEKEEAVSGLNLSADILYEMESIEVWNKLHLNLPTFHSLSIMNRYRGQEPPIWIKRFPPITFCEQTDAMKAAPDQYLPEVSTCTMSIRLPHYSESGIMKKKLLKAITLCTTFDTMNPQFPSNAICQGEVDSIQKGTKQRINNLFTEKE